MLTNREWVEKILEIVDGRAGKEREGTTLRLMMLVDGILDARHDTAALSELRACMLQSEAALKQQYDGIRSLVSQTIDRIANIIEPPG